MPERTVRLDSYNWMEPVLDEDGALVGQLLREAPKGAVVDLSVDEAARGDSLGAFVTGEDEATADAPASIAVAVPAKRGPGRPRKQ